MNDLYLITGMPAVGKSSFARELARRTRGCLIDIDTTTETIVRAAMSRLTGNGDDRDSSIFKDTFRDPIYETLFAVADENLRHTHAIVTGPFTRELGNRNWPAEVKARLQSPCQVKCVFLHCDHELRRQRIVARANPRDQPKLADWEQHLKYYAPDAAPSYPHLSVDTGAADCFDNAVSAGLLA